VCDPTIINGPSFTSKGPYVCLNKVAWADRFPSRVPQSSQPSDQLDLHLNIKSAVRISKATPTENLVDRWVENDKKRRRRRRRRRSGSKAKPQEEEAEAKQNHTKCPQTKTPPYDDDDETPWLATPSPLSTGQVSFQHFQLLGEYICV
jgi:hypothetical protein